MMNRNDRDAFYTGVIFTTALALSALASGAQGEDPISRITTYRVDGVERQAIVQPGSGPEPAGGRPMILGFHGHGGNMRFSERNYDLHALWPEAIVIYPQGLPSKGMTDPEGEKNGWQQRPGESGDRDLEFVDTIFAQTKGYNPKRVYSMGHSNGGRFTYVLWQARGEKFAAYGPSGAPPLRPFGQLKPTSFLATAGFNDPLIKFAGQELGVKGIARTFGVDLSTGVKRGDLVLAKKGDIEIGTYFFDGGHTYPKEAIAATVAMFKRHSL